jgi:hypothetical protein
MVSSMFPEEHEVVLSYLLPSALFPFPPLSEYIAEREYAIGFFRSKNALIDCLHILYGVKSIRIEVCNNVEHMSKFIPLYN